MTKKASKVLVAPLNWGLGHATRCMPLIDALLVSGVEVVLAGSGRSLALLQLEYPQLRSVVLPDYKVLYNKDRMEWAMIVQSPKILKAIRDEKNFVDDLQKKENFDLVISDNRFGVFCADAHNVFVTHQLNIKVSGMWSLLKPLIDGGNNSFMQKFQEVWIPDEAGEKSLSGELSLTKNTDSIKHIGVCSRMRKPLVEMPKTYRSVSILSGPEPQRTKLEELLLKQLQHIRGNHLLVRGIPKSNEKEVWGNVERVDFLNAIQLEKALGGCEVAISRSGYSSLMDYVSLGQRAILIPTPGQTEQEYLADRMVEKNWFYAKSQRDLYLPEAFKAVADYKCPTYEQNTLLQKVVEEVLEKL